MPPLPLMRRVRQVFPPTAPLDLPAAVAAGLDCNGNGIEDAIDIANGTSSDLDGDGVPDECQVGR